VKLYLRCWKEHYINRKHLFCYKYCYVYYFLLILNKLSDNTLPARWPRNDGLTKKSSLNGGAMSSAPVSLLWSPASGHPGVLASSSLWWRQARRLLERPLVLIFGPWKGHLSDSVAPERLLSSSVVPERILFSLVYFLVRCLQILLCCCILL